MIAIVLLAPLLLAAAVAGSGSRATPLELGLPAVSLNVTSPLANSFVSGRAITVTADIWLNDEHGEDIGKFVKRYGPKMKVCVVLETRGFYDIFADGEQAVAKEEEVTTKTTAAAAAAAYKQKICNELESAGLKFRDVPYGLQFLRAYVELEGDEISQSSFTFHTTARKSTAPKVTNEVSLQYLREEQTLLQWFHDGHNDLRVSSDISPPPPPVHPCSQVPSKFDSSQHDASSSAWGSRRFLIIGIKTSSDGFQNRMALRKTWLQVRATWT